MSSLADLKRLLARRSQAKTKLLDIKAFIEQLRSDINHREIKNRIDEMYKIRDDYEKVNIDIMCFDDTEIQTASDVSKADLLELNTFGNLWYRVLSELQDLLEQNSPVASETSTNAEQSPIPVMTQQFNVKLPVIDLPTFSGKQTEWLSFYDDFQSLIHKNNSLDDCQKLHYLKSCLKGDAARAIETLPKSSGNYQAAWSILQNRYKNTRLLIQAHIESILSFPEITKASAESLQQLIDNIINNLQSLKILQVPVDSWDDFLVTVIMNKLNYHIRCEYENTLDSNPVPLTHLMNFLEKKRGVLNSINQSSKPKPSQNNSNTNSTKKSSQYPINRSTHAATTSKSICYFCERNHFINQCEEFLRLSTSERANEIKKRNLCQNCLRSNHRVNECKSSGCRVCHSRFHHTLLHENRCSVQQQSHSSANHCTSLSNTHVVLSTAIVLIKDSAGNYRQVRALLDVGSQINILSESVSKLLSLPVNEQNISISSINDSYSNSVKTTQITLKSMHQKYEIRIGCCVLKNVTTTLPTESFDKSIMRIPENVVLADPNFNENGPIDLLLGAEIFWNILCIGRIKLFNPSLYLSKTLLGWVVGGAFSKECASIVSCNIAVKQNHKKDLDGLLERFWVQEEINPGTKNWSREENECEQHFIDTYRRDPKDGRFVVELPFKNNTVNLGDSSRNAVRRFLSVERKFRKNHEFKQTYCKAIRELIDNGYLEEISITKIENENVFYLPHTGIFKRDSNNSKIRIVYDGSAKSSNGLSLNDNLMTGPNIQNDLFAILIRFRTYAVVFSCDMEKMFLQIKVEPKNTKFQLIYWRFDESEPLRVFRLTRLVFGLTNSPYTAMRCVMQLAYDLAIEFPEASQTLINNRFMDDILTGSSNVRDAIELRDQLIEGLGRGGFKLSKWSSNAPEIITNPYIDNLTDMVDLNKAETAKVLGLWWDPLNDSLNYRIETQSSSVIYTKRTILSTIAKIYDPIGIISPVIIKAKILIQQLWSMKLNWDDPVPQNIATEWLKFLNELEYINELKIPRKIISNTNAETDLVVFCDASMRAYGAAVYVRNKIDNDIYATSLICSKSRVSPLKVISLPRLELCAALLGAELMDKICRQLGLNINNKYYFTDSMIVLHYINGNANAWQIFVANRVSKIQELSSSNAWYHVDSKNNPADMISRGANPRQMNCKLYWSGPDFISKPLSNWPENKFRPMPEVNGLLEKRKATATVCVKPIFPLLQKFSSFTKLQRVVAYCFRFITNSRRGTRTTGVLSTEELNNAHNVIIRLVQNQEFSIEVLALQNQKHVAKNSKLLHLDLFIDQNGLIRLGGRLRSSRLSYDKRFPILLPAKHHVTKLLMRKEHLSLLHAGATQTLSSLRTRYWPLKARNEIRKIIHSCITCFRVSPRLIKQKMGDLPEDRTIPCKPFLKVGLDYFGPIFIKQGGKRNTKLVKAWVALFVCMVTKAIHLEVVSDLTSECFINALKRFCSRRGKVSHIYCDNSTTFIGAKNQIDEIFKFLHDKNLQQEIQPFITENNITWKFIPPRSPNFGGLWERLVRSAKEHLKKVVMNAYLTLEEAITLMTQIEAIVNSRPLTPLSNDPSDLQVLTPAHFLIGESLVNVPEYDILDIAENRLNRWQRIEKLKQHFWKRWSREVLTQLHPKSKWCQPVPNLQIGTLVLISEDNLPPMVWKIGRVEEVYPGPDGHVRVASVRTKQGIYRRSIRKLAILPIDADNAKETDDNPKETDDIIDASATSTVLVESVVS